MRLRSRTTAPSSTGCSGAARASAHAARSPRRGAARRALSAAPSAPRAGAVSESCARLERERRCAPAERRRRAARHARARRDLVAEARIEPSWSATRAVAGSLPRRRPRLRGRRPAASAMAAAALAAAAERGTRARAQPCREEMAGCARRPPSSACALAWPPSATLRGSLRAAPGRPREARPPRARRPRRGGPQTCTRAPPVGRGSACAPRRGGPVRVARAPLAAAASQTQRVARLDPRGAIRRKTRRER